MYQAAWDWIFIDLKYFLGTIINLLIQNGNYRNHLKSVVKQIVGTVCYQNSHSNDQKALVTPND
jgi:hypothetical protein